MQTNFGRLIATIFLVSLSRNIFVACSAKHHQCKRIDALKALNKRDNAAPLSCTGKLVSNYNEKRIPQMISEIVCPSEMGDRCIQLVLPMDVFIPRKRDQSLQKIIYVPSGCIDSQQMKKPHNKIPKPNGNNKNQKTLKGFRAETASTKIVRRRRYVNSATD